MATRSQQLAITAKHCYNVAIANEKTEAEALEFARSMAAGHRGPSPHSFTDTEIRAGVCKCAQCAKER